MRRASLERRLVIGLTLGITLLWLIAAIVELLYGCGLRVGELVGLDVQASGTARGLPPAHVGVNAGPLLFDQGDYVPLEARGAKAGHVVAFLRRHQGRTLRVATLRLPASGPQPGSDGWGDTVLVLPQAAGEWRDVLSANHLVKADGDTLALGLVLGERPVAVLLAQ